MPGYNPIAVLAPFSLPVTEVAIKASAESYPADYIIANILELSGYLNGLVEHTNLFGALNNDPYSPSLKTLHDRLQAGYLMPSPISALTKDAKRLKQMLDKCITVAAAKRPLEDFEDVYYAILARMQAMLHTLNIRLSSGFNTPTDLLFTHGPDIVSLHASLTQYWDLLNHPACARALDDAIRQSRVNHIYTEIMTELNANIITSADADALLLDLYTDKDSAEGLDEIRCGSPAMIGAWLEEKYRTMLMVEKEENERVAREMHRHAKMKVAVPKVQKRTSQNPRKRTSLQKMLEGMERLQDGPGTVVGEAMREVGAKLPDKAVLHQPVRYLSQAVDQDRAGKIQQRQSKEWELKAQRVSEYSQYLRGAASRNARRVVSSTMYNSAPRASNYDNTTLPEDQEYESGVMEF
jgi:hypothetical protein